MSTLDEMEMPTLTFDPAPEPEEKAPVVPVQEEKAKLDDSMLNDKERQMVESFAKQMLRLPSTLTFTASGSPAGLANGEGK